MLAPCVPISKRLTVVISRCNLATLNTRCLSLTFKLKEFFFDPYTILCPVHTYTCPVIYVHMYSSLICPVRIYVHLSFIQMLRVCTFLSRKSCTYCTVCTNVWRSKSNLNSSIKRRLLELKRFFSSKLFSMWLPLV